MKRKLILSGIGMILSILLLIVTEFLAEKQIIRPTLSVVLVVIFIGVLLTSAVWFSQADCEMNFFECRNCGHIFKTTLAEYLCGAHTPNARRLKCPQCGKKTWCKRRNGKQ